MDCPKRMDLASAIQKVKDGDIVLVGGFGLSGMPFILVEGLLRFSTAKELTIVSNNAGYPGVGLGKVVAEKRARRLVGSFFTRNPDVVRQFTAGELDVQVVPQGTLAESIRAGGVGIAAYFTPSGAGTELAEGKETRMIHGRLHVLEEAIHGQVAFIKAHRADAYGNLTYRKTARNFNPLMAKAADFVVAEVEEIVPAGALNPEEIQTPHVYVDALVLSGEYQSLLEGEEYRRLFSYEG